MKNLLQNKKIKLLKDYFEKQPEVLIAFLFGSYAKGFAMEESDIDIAVYLKDKNGEDKIGSQINRILDKDVDLLVLNDAPATLVSNIFQTGIPLAIKDKRLYWKIYLKASAEAEDFVNFLEDFWAIYKRSKSLIPVDKARLLERVCFLLEELKEVGEFRKLTFKEYKEEKSKRRIIERWVEVICNATLDIAKLILASEKKRMPKTYEQALYDFGILAGLSEKESEKFSKFANLRNLLAHEYLDILYSKIQTFLKEAPEIYKKIFIFLEEYLRKS